MSLRRRRDGGHRWSRRPCMTPSHTTRASGHIWAPPAARAHRRPKGPHRRPLVDGINRGPSDGLPAAPITWRNLPLAPRGRCADHRVRRGHHPAPDDRGRIGAGWPLAATRPPPARRLRTRAGPDLTGPPFRWCGGVGCANSVPTRVLGQAVEVHHPVDSEVFTVRWAGQTIATPGRRHPALMTCGIPRITPRRSMPRSRRPLAAICIPCHHHRMLPAIGSMKVHTGEPISVGNSASTVARRSSWRQR